jgi:hypothetical protein
MVILLVMMAGCGYKGNPVSYVMVVQDKKPIIKNMETLAVGEVISLKWNFQDKSGIICYIKIERSDTVQCKGCPQIFTGIGQVTVKEGKPVGNEQMALNFVDSQVVKGHIYNYHLMLCEENMNCSEAAKMEINFK